MHASVGIQSGARDVVQSRIDRTTSSLGAASPPPLPPSPTNNATAADMSLQHVLMEESELLCIELYDYACCECFGESGGRSWQTRGGVNYVLVARAPG